MKGVQWLQFTGTLYVFKREKEGEWGNFHMLLIYHRHTCVHTRMYIYIYIYMHIHTYMYISLDSRPSLLLPRNYINLKMQKAERNGEKRRKGERAWCTTMRKLANIV